MKYYEAIDENKAALHVLVWNDDHTYVYIFPFLFK